MGQGIKYKRVWELATRVRPVIGLLLEGHFHLMK